jgi:hypothetical protein
MGEIEFVIMMLITVGFVVLVFSYYMSIRYRCCGRDN